MTTAMLHIIVLLAALAASLGLAWWALVLSLPRYRRGGRTMGRDLSPAVAADPSGNPNTPGGR